MDDSVTMLDILLVSFFSFILWFVEKRYRLAKDEKFEFPPPLVFNRSRGKKFYWVRMDAGDKLELKIWTKQDST